MTVSSSAPPSIVSSPSLPWIVSLPAFAVEPDVAPVAPLDAVVGALALDAALAGPAVEDVAAVRGAREAVVAIDGRRCRPRRRRCRCPSRRAARHDRPWPTRSSRSLPDTAVEVSRQGEADYPWCCLGGERVGAGPAVGLDRGDGPARAGHGRARFSVPALGRGVGVDGDQARAAEGERLARAAAAPAAWHRRLPVLHGQRVRAAGAGRRRSAFPTARGCRWREPAPARHTPPPRGRRSARGAIACRSNLLRRGGSGPARAATPSLHRRERGTARPAGRAGRAGTCWRMPPARARRQAWVAWSAAGVVDPQGRRRAGGGLRRPARGHRRLTAYASAVSWAISSARTVAALSLSTWQVPAAAWPPPPWRASARRCSCGCAPSRIDLPVGEDGVLLLQAPDRVDRDVALRDRARRS